MPPRQTKAIAHLRAVDPILGAWIDRAGPCGWEVKADGTHFDHVARSIVYQQVSGAAAATVYGRMLGLYRGKAPTPRQILATSDERLRGVGLSGRKVEYIKGLAEQLVAKRLPLERIDEMPDDEVIATLTFDPRDRGVDGADGVDVPVGAPGCAPDARYCAAARGEGAVRVAHTADAGTAGEDRRQVGALSDGGELVRVAAGR